MQPVGDSTHVFDGCMIHNLIWNLVRAAPPQTHILTLPAISDSSYQWANSSDIGCLTTFTTRKTVHIQEVCCFTDDTSQWLLFFILRNRFWNYNVVNTQSKLKNNDFQWEMDSIVFCGVNFDWRFAVYVRIFPT